MPWIKSTAIAICLLITSLANAAQPLTGDQIQQWLKSIDEIQQWADKQEALGANLPDNPDDQISAESIIAQLRAANLYDEAEDLMQSNGFDSPEEWADIQMRIIKAMVSLELDKENVNVDIQAQLDQIRNNPSIPDDQKEMMINMMQSSMKMMESMSNAPEADKTAIKPYLPKIRQKLDTEGVRQ